MCGIGAISSAKLSQNLLMREFLDMCYLSFVAHRGRHSNGVAWIRNGRIEVVKELGAPGEKVYLAAADSHLTQTVIGHVRIASQGAINLTNAHPIYNEDKSMVIIHNGHLVNTAALQREVSSHKLTTQTDSELILHLFEDALKIVPFTPAGYAKAMRVATDKCFGSRNIIIMMADGTLIVHAEESLYIERSENIRLASAPTTRSKNWAHLKSGTILVIKDGKVLEKLDPAPRDPVCVQNHWNSIIVNVRNVSPAPKDQIVMKQTKIQPGTLNIFKRKIDWGFKQ